MKIFVVLSCLVATSFAMLTMRNTEYMWEQWKLEHGKSYDSNGDEEVRRYVWEKNLKYVDEHNERADNGEHTFRLGMNQFADLTNEEFRQRYLRPFVRKSACKNASEAFFEQDELYRPPHEVDWRKHGYVTEVKNQGQCGSCWAFSTTGSLEGAHFKHTGKLVSLSEQNLMDCSKPEGDFSCEGGLMDFAFEYIERNGGIDTEASYPYEARDETTCRFTKANIGATVSSCADVRSGCEKSLQRAVGAVGPISVAIDASHQSFQLYHSGVYQEPECSSKALDHGVLVVGYGNDDGNDFWIVKNSWGTSWGMKGYITMSRNNKNNCGIATSASYPVE